MPQGFGQSTDAMPKFEIADVRIAPPSANQGMRNLGTHGGRYEIRNATMLDLVRIAYGYDSDKVLGGPSWLEMDRFDIAAKVPAETSADALKPMLQSLLADRFQLVIRKEDKPLPTYALKVGKKLQIKQADGSGETGCYPLPGDAGPQARVGGMIAVGGPNGQPITIRFGPDMMVTYQCRNMTMDMFVSAMRRIIGADVGANPILNETGLEGAWNFDVQYSVMRGPAATDRVTFLDAVEKQLGLKMEPKQVPTPVIVVEKVNQKPTGNPPGVAEALPPIPIPTEFEVASVKPSDPGARPGGIRTQPGGRLQADGAPMTSLLYRAFNLTQMEAIANVPKWASTERFDITAKAPALPPAAPPIDLDGMAPMVRALLADRFKMTYHTEDRQVSAFTLVPAKPKMKKADPGSRARCSFAAPPAGSPQGSQVYTCQNISMAQFAERIHSLAQGVPIPGMNWPVVDATGIEGGWDFTLLYSITATYSIIAGRSGDPAAAGAAPSAADPNGGLTLFEAIEKQLGLKLELQKRTEQIIVIDHLEQKPTEN